MDNVVDITPKHDPMGLAKEMVSRAPDAKVGIAVLIKKDGEMWFDCCGNDAAYVVYALERMKHQIMMDTP